MHPFFGSSFGWEAKRVALRALGLLSYPNFVPAGNLDPVAQLLNFRTTVPFRAESLELRRVSEIPRIPDGVPSSGVYRPRGAGPKGLNTSPKVCVPEPLP